MAGNIFGQIFRITTFGESHGPALGMIIDGCPPNLEIAEEDIQREVDRRRPQEGSSIVTKRHEEDRIKILSGVFENRTTGMPIAVIVENKDTQSKDYTHLKDVFRPGHADFTYEMKYGIRDHRSGGRSSGRETVCRVIAGAIAKKILQKEVPTLKIIGRTIQVGHVKARKFAAEEIEKNQIRCADHKAAEQMIQYVEKLRSEGDSSGGIVEIIVKNPPPGLGEPVFDKLDADIAKALMSIGSIKGVEIGSGFMSAELTGSQNNDEFYTCASAASAKREENRIRTKTNNAGGILGGISNGEDIVIRIAVKPPSSIAKAQKTVDKEGKMIDLNIQGRHDACIVPRVIPVAESMVAITLADHLLRLKTLK